MPFYAVALLEFYFSFINIDAVCLLAYFRRCFEINLQNSLWFVAVLNVSPSTACLSLILFFFYFYASAMTVLLLVLLVCVRSFMESWFRLCFSLWFSIIRDLLNKNVALVSDRVHVPLLFFLCDFPSLWFLNFLNNDIYYEQMDRTVMASSVFSKMYLQLLEHTVPQQNLYYVCKRIFKIDFCGLLVTML